MSILTDLGKKAAGYATGFNWYALALKALLCVMLVTVTWMKATEHCELKHERQKTAIAKQQVQQVTKRVPEVQKQAKESLQKQNEIDNAGKQLDEANKANPTGGCNLSPDQLRSYRELADKTRS
jgi:uncharacterized membrane protein YhiD involved in acid resistance